MNPADTMKLMGAFQQFQSTHPKVVAFARAMIAGGIPEGTVIEMSVTRPGEEPIATNMKIQPSDLELFEELKKMR